MLFLLRMSRKTSRSRGGSKREFPLTSKKKTKKRHRHKTDRVGTEKAKWPYAKSGKTALESFPGNAFVSRVSTHNTYSCRCTPDKLGFSVVK